MPHVVQHVADLMDAQGLMQGQQGYHNKHVMPGDHIIAIDGVNVETKDIGFLHAAMRGNYMTAVSLTLRRDTQIFCIQVRSHRSG